jgi:hypothetical protein
MEEKYWLLSTWGVPMVSGLPWRYSQGPHPRTGFPQEMLLVGKG